ncbi:aldehyde dehydrogenase family protein [Arthrobacter sp. ISL-5]|uniref:aldehyde dehydrogenase family protein n=1 Tax=Arthrobacter sp. ISL-5 TaxID=2819111 RepID=UPI001BEB8DF6|nr:aldehyde dehydrogenase family protein [Arthrobacter sp. ISL-5]
MTITTHEPAATAGLSDKERFGAILAAQRSAQLRRVLDRTTSGNVTVNGTIMHVGQDDLPFGGVGESGMGKYHGIEGFRTLSHPKGIYTQGRWNAADLLHAPFGKRADRLLGFFLR